MENQYFNNINSPFVHKVTPERMSKILAEKIPLEDRLKSVYLSTILLDVVGVISEQLLKTLKAMGSKETLANSRAIREVVQEYYDSNNKAMKPQLYYAVHQKSLRFYNKICKNLLIYEFSYNSAVMNIQQRGCGGNKSMVLAICYVIKSILNYILEFDREMDASIREKLGPSITYVTEDNVFCVKILKQVDLLIDFLNGPRDIDSKHISLSYAIFKKEVNLIDIKNISA